MHKAMSILLWELMGKWDWPLFWLKTGGNAALFSPGFFLQPFGLCKTFWDYKRHKALSIILCELKGKWNWPHFWLKTWRNAALFSPGFFLKPFGLWKKIGTIKCTKLCRFCCENLWVNEIGHFFDWKQGEMLPFFFSRIFLRPFDLCKKVWDYKRHKALSIIVCELKGKWNWPHFWLKTWRNAALFSPGFFLKPFGLWKKNWDHKMHKAMSILLWELMGKWDWPLFWLKTGRNAALFSPGFFCDRSTYAHKFVTIKRTKLCQFFGENSRVNEAGQLLDKKQGEMLPFFLQDFFWSRSASEKKLGP